MKNTLSKLGPLTLPAAFAAFLLILFTFSRVLNYFLFRGKISATIDVFKVFFIGARVDLASACMAALLLLFVFLCLPRRWVTRLRYVVAAYVTLMLGASLFLEAATPSFIHEFGLRPNQLIFEHVFDFKKFFRPSSPTTSSN